uniref:Protein unc-79 homolog isoform X3 n=1 Tax=Hirondellea gigas TaxID=1518452 RepID=A0A6A7G266_9CRUS
MECVYQDGVASFSTSLFPLFETFLRKLTLCFNILEDVNPLIRLLCALFRIPGVVGHKSILDPVSKSVVFALRKAPVKYSLVADLCFLCCRSFQRERDKLYLARMMVLELVQALKFKVSLPDTNLVLLVQLILQDNGGGLGPNPVLDTSGATTPDSSSLLAECVRASYLNDIIDFIADVHTLTKIKSGLNQDTIGGLLKAGLSQYLALEISRGSTRDSRFFNKFLPWLNSPPTTVQQGPKEFLECVGHIRLLSWLLVGSLMHTCHRSSTGTPTNCMPVPPDASCHIADHIQVILAGFPEQSKASVVNMSSLFLAFILSQVWTVYLEQNAGSPGTDLYNSTCALLTDFWAKVTPAILQLVSHSKVLGEMVSLHFLSLLEALQECGSTVLTRLLPLWAPLLYSPHHAKLPDQLAVRLQACQDAIPVLPPPTTQANSAAVTDDTSNLPKLNSSPMSSSTVLPNLLTWLNRLQFKMGQIELQSSAATQFYSM